MVRRRRQAVAPAPPPPAPPSPVSAAVPTTDPDRAVAELRHAEAVVAAAERRAEAAHAEAEAIMERADAEVAAAIETLTRVRTAARAAARAAQRTGRALEPATHATALPGDVLRHIAQLLPRTDILSMACVCTAWKEMLVALPSPLFPSVSVGIDALLSGSEALPAYNDLLARSNDILSLRVRGCVLKREFAFVSTLVTQLTRLTSLALEHDATPTSRPEWTQGVFRAAAAACPGLTAVEMTFGAGRGAAHRRRPISGSLFSGLGADALGA